MGHFSQASYLIWVSRVELRQKEEKMRKNIKRVKAQIFTLL